LGSLANQRKSGLQVECAEISLIGDRDDNQDRVTIASGDSAALLIVLDGMGGHAEGARAAEVAVASLVDTFKQTSQPVFDPLGFLHLAVGTAHEEVVKLGAGISMETKPRATCAVSLVQEGSAYWVHVGDSRVYQLRDRRMVERTRDHSHVEVLLREGLITEEEIQTHPMRNFVECCLGGDSTLPEMSISQRKKLQTGDIILLCTDGLWSGLDDQSISSFYAGEGPDLQARLQSLGQRAVKANAPYSDNTTAAALRWLK